MLVYFFKQDNQVSLAQCNGEKAEGIPKSLCSKRSKLAVQWPAEVNTQSCSNNKTNVLSVITESCKLKFTLLQWFLFFYLFLRCGYEPAVKLNQSHVPNNLITLNSPDRVPTLFLKHTLGRLWTHRAEGLGTGQTHGLCVTNIPSNAF